MYLRNLTRGVLNLLNNVVAELERRDAAAADTQQPPPSQAGEKPLSPHAPQNFVHNVQRVRPSLLLRSRDQQQVMTLCISHHSVHAAFGVLKRTIVIKNIDDMFNSYM